MKRVTSLTLLIIFSIIIIGCETGEKEVRLAFKYWPNQTCRFASTVKTSYEVVEDEIPPVTKSFSYKTNLVQNVVSMIDSTTARVRLCELPAEFDSAGEAVKNDLSDNAFAIEYIIGTNGKLLDIISSVSGIEDANFYKNYFEQALPVFPDRPITRGYSWTQTVKVVIKDEGTTRAETTYKVKSFGREAGYDCAIIEYQGNLILPFRYTKKDGTIVTGLDRVDSRGTLYFAYREGVIVRQDEAYDSRSNGTCTLNSDIKHFQSTRKSTSALQLIAIEN